MLSFLLFFVASSAFCCKRLLRYLHFFQQEGYDPFRFLKWIWEQKAFDKRGSLSVVIMAFLAFLAPNLSFVLGFFAFSYWAFSEENPLKKGKIKLNMTDRAKRLFMLSGCLLLLGQISLCFLKLYPFLLAQIILIQSIPFFLIVATAILSRDERQRQKKFIREAENLFKEVSPYVIGITGSYGKTSTKNALGNILQVSLKPTFWPKKGVNTEMGITREIREQLKKGMHFAVIEMGAYAQGSIAKLCRLTPPNAGIITTVGVAHLDRFGDKETILKAKSELAAAIPENGILVCNGDNEGARSIAKKYPKKNTLLYGFDNKNNDLACWIQEILVSEKGTTFSLLWKDQTYKAKTALIGHTAISNLCASFTMACALGANPELAIGAIANLKPVDNRLQLHQEGDLIFLRDAYNSNPDGFCDALQVLSVLNARKKILITPGMIELGPLSEFFHHQVGKKAAEVCDFVIIVGETNRLALMKGLLEGGMPSENIILVGEREESFARLKELAKKGDAVLIENDLPDLYKNVVRF